MSSGFRRDKFSVQHYLRGTLPADECFVLVPSRDPAAVQAIRAYAESTPDVLLAAELQGWADRIEGIRGPDRSLLRPQIAIWTSTLADEVRAGTMSIETALQRIAGHTAIEIRKEP